MDLKVARRLIRSPRSQGLHTGDGAFIDVEIDFRLFPVKVGDIPLTLDDDDGPFDIFPSWVVFQLCTSSLEEGVRAEPFLNFQWIELQHGLVSSGDINR